MLRKSALFVVFAAAPLAVACSKPDPESVSKPPPIDDQKPAEMSSPDPATERAGSKDPTVLDPDHYTTEFENEAVRIVRIKYSAGEESVMHYHPDSVAVFVTDIEGQMTMPDGSTEEFADSAGKAVFNPAGEHLPRNTSDSSWEVIEVELKPRDTAQGEAGGPDATVVDAEHYSMEYENEAVRIVRIRYGAGEESVMHYHPDSVAVFLTDHLVQMTMPDGSTDEVAATAGDAMFIPGGQHLPKNISDSAWELALIELKQ